MSEWGTKEEKFNRFCIVAQFYRYCYYVVNDPIVSDAEYDELERFIELLEAKNPEMKSRFSPTKTVGSSDPEDYPRYFGQWYDGVKSGRSPEKAWRVRLPEKWRERIRQYQKTGEAK